MNALSKISNNVNQARGSYLPAFTPPGVAEGHGARHWTRIAPDWQDDIAARLEQWLCAPDSDYDPLNTKDVDGAIRDYEAQGAVTLAQGQHLRRVWRESRAEVA